MRLRNRGLFVLLAGVSAVLIGCGGGGGGSGGGPVPTTVPTRTATPTAGPTTATTAPTGTPTTATGAPTATPTAVPTVAGSPTAAPTALPTGSANPVSSRPLNSGDTFSFAGNSIEAFIYYGATPNPSGTIPETIAQTVTDEGTSSFDGATPEDLKTTETDVQQSPAKTTTVTTNTYYANGSYSVSQTGFYTYGYTSSDSDGQQITDTLANVGDTSGTFNGLIDVLPETGEQTWTNTAAQTIDESESDGFTANRTYAANGTYTENDTYPQNSQFTPPPTPMAATLTENSDGSGTYNLPISGISPPNVNVAYSAPSSTITITASQGGQSQTYTVSTWYSLPLYSETDRDDGALSIPSGCHVPAQYGTSANGIEQKFTRFDTVVGTAEYFDQITYVVGGYAVCVTLNDITYVFYDYSGQGNEAPLGVSFSGGSSPLEVITTASVVGLTSTNVSGAARERGTRDLQGASGRVAGARTSFLAALERRRLERRDRAFQRFGTTHFMGSHR